MSFINDLHESNKTWNRFKAEILEHIKGELIDIEAQSSPLAQMFDQYSGVDAIHIVKGYHHSPKMRGVAIRCQYGNAWNSFTIRYSRSTGTTTEYIKRREAIYGDGGFWYPYLTIQIYANKLKESNRFFSCGIIRTKDIYDYIEENFDKILQKVNPQDGNIFLVIFWNELEKAGKKLLTFP